MRAKGYFNKKISENINWAMTTLTLHWKCCQRCPCTQVALELTQGMIVQTNNFHKMCQGPAKRDPSIAVGPSRDAWQGCYLSKFWRVNGIFFFFNLEMTWFSGRGHDISKVWRHARQDYSAGQGLWSLKLSMNRNYLESLSEAVFLSFALWI